MKKATEQASFLLVTALYLIIVGVGAGIDSPPLAVNSLLVVGLTIAVFHHLLNVYTVASLVDSYPRWPFVLDLAAIGVLAMMFTILAHPLVGDYGSFRPFHWPPAFLDGGEQARYLKQVVGDEPRITGAQALEMFRHSMYRFFCLGAILWVLLFAWHTVVIVTEKKHIHLKKPLVHIISFGAYGALIMGGLFLTRQTPTVPVDVWTVRMTLLNVFSTLAVVTAAAMLWVEYAKGAKYERAPLTVWSRGRAGG